MASTIAAANWCEWFLKTIPKILRTFFTDTLETHQFAAVEFTLNQRLSTKVNCSCLDKAQNLPVEKIINADFFPLEFVNGEFTMPQDISECNSAQNWRSIAPLK